MHYIKVYVPLNNQQYADWTMSNLHWMLNIIFFMGKDFLVVVAGDFNIVGMKKNKFLLDKYNLTKALREDMATHRKGGTLIKS